MLTPPPSRSPLRLPPSGTSPWLLELPQASGPFHLLLAPTGVSLSSQSGLTLQALRQGCCPCLLCPRAPPATTLCLVAFCSCAACRYPAFTVFAGVGDSCVMGEAPTCPCTSGSPAPRKCLALSQGWSASCGARETQVFASDPGLFSLPCCAQPGSHLLLFIPS